MKSTPTRGVKQYLKPNAYKQSEPLLQITCDLKKLQKYQIASNLMGG